MVVGGGDGVGVVGGDGGGGPLHSTPKAALRGILKGPEQFCVDSLLNFHYKIKECCQVLPRADL